MLVLTTATYRYHTFNASIVLVKAQSDEHTVLYEDDEESSARRTEADIIQ